MPRRLPSSLVGAAVSRLWLLLVAAGPAAGCGDGGTSGSDGDGDVEPTDGGDRGDDGDVHVDAGGSCRRDDFVPGCRPASTAPDVPYRIDIPERSSFVAQVSSLTGFNGVLHLRRTCEVAASELACDDDSGPCWLCPRIPSSGALTLDPGSYYPIMDAYATGYGPFTIGITATRL